MYSKKTKYDPLSDNAVESTNCHNQYQLSQYPRASQHSQQAILTQLINHWKKPGVRYHTASLFQGQHKRKLGTDI